MSIPHAPGSCKQYVYWNRPGCSVIPSNPHTDLPCPFLLLSRLLSCDLSPLWKSKVWLNPVCFSLPPLACIPPTPPFLLVIRSIVSQRFYTHEVAAWLLADVDKGWRRCCCQAIQIISGIKRSIASFSISCRPLPTSVYFFAGRTSFEIQSKIFVTCTRGHSWRMKMSAVFADAVILKIKMTFV